MNRKSVYIIFTSIALIFLTVGLSLIVINNKEYKKQPVNEGNPKEENTTAYTIKLVESDGFTLRSEMYNDKNNLNIYIKSQDKHSSLNIESYFYDSNGTIVGSYQEWAAFVNSDDEVLSNLSLDSSVVKSVIVKVTSNDSNNNISFYDKNKIKFESQPTIENNNIAINLKTTTPFDSPINWISGYVLIYQNDKVIDVEPFLIENSEKNNEISTTIIAKNIKKYDFIKVFINGVE